MNSAQSTEIKAILTRAAHVEAARQVAREGGDQNSVWECEQELALLWRQWTVGKQHVSWNPA